MFTSAIRTNYKIKAEQEAEEIKNRLNAYKVIYTGSRLFAVFATPQDEIGFLKAQANYNHRHGSQQSCKCWQ